MILDKVCSVTQLTATTGDSDKQTYQAVTGASAVKMNIQPASGELTVLAEGQYAKTFRFFTTYSGLAVGQRVTVSGTGDIYEVQGVEDWDFGPMPHYEGALVKMEA